MIESLNHDFVTAYKTLDEKLSDSLGIDGYLNEARRVMPYQKRNHPEFDKDIDTLATMQTLYRQLLNGKDAKTRLASEDDIDYLYDLMRRFDEKRDPLSRLTDKVDHQNPEAQKYTPIEAESREVSRRVISQRKRIAAVSLTAAILTVGITLLIKLSRGDK